MLGKFASLLDLKQFISMCCWVMLSWDQVRITPHENERLRHLKRDQNLLKGNCKYTSSHQQFSGDMLVFRGAKLRVTLLDWLYDGYQYPHCCSLIVPPKLANLINPYCHCKLLLSYLQFHVLMWKKHQPFHLEFTRRWFWVYLCQLNWWILEHKNQRKRANKNTEPPPLAPFTNLK